jgi:hypothetical protein
VVYPNTNSGVGHNENAKGQLLAAITDVDQARQDMKQGYFPIALRYIRHVLYLALEGDGARLALRADALGPWRMVLATVLYCAPELCSNG